MLYFICFPQGGFVCDDTPAEIDMKAVIDQQAKEVHVMIHAGLAAADTAKLVRMATPAVANAVAGQLVVDVMRPALQEAKFEGEAIMRGALPPGEA